jgi:osmotically-inducible protein OsmY
MTHHPLAAAATRAIAALALGAAAVTTLGGCAPLIVGGAMAGGALMVIDRRTSGTQIEDQTIELKAGSRIRELATFGHINITSYNRIVLLTGEVPTEEDKRRVEDAVGRVEQVKTVVNELEVMPNSSLGSRSSDSLLSTKVKATLVDAKDLQAPAIKVITERGTVFLMGLVTEREANRSAELIATIPGVRKVVKAFEVISENELAGIQSRSTPR